MVVQWLRLRALNAGGLGSIPGQETRSHMTQLRVCIPQLRPSAAKLKKNWLQNQALRELKFTVLPAKEQLFIHILTRAAHHLLIPHVPHPTSFSTNAYNITTDSQMEDVNGLPQWAVCGQELPPALFRPSPGLW